MHVSPLNRNDMIIRNKDIRYGSFSAAFVALTLGLAACHPEKEGVATPEGSTVKTENVEWNEKESEEGCKLSADYPTDGTCATAQNIREWMNEQLGGTYRGNLDNGKGMLEYYGTERAEQVKRDIAELGENTAMDHASYFVKFRKAFETEKFVTYTSDIYVYSGGAHGGTTLSGGVFRKPDGRRFGWDMFKPQSTDKLRGMIKEGLKRDYFKVENDEEFYAMLLAENARYDFPLPATDPVCMPDGVQFIYQQYEIAPYAAGIPSCTLPYDSLQGLFTVTMEPLVESTTNSLATHFKAQPKP